MKTLLLCLGILLTAGQAWAAPYDLESPPESYTWGESQAVVKNMLPEAQVVDKHIMYLPPDSDQDPATVFVFWQNQLLSISSTTGRSSDMATAQTQYQMLREKLSAQWGKPSAPAPCLTDETDCTVVTWQVSPATTLRLAMMVREMPDGQAIFISHSYSSSRLFSAFLKEYKELGPLERLENIMPRLIAGKNTDALIGRRIRLSLPVAELKPLTLDGQAYSVVCQMQDDKALAGLRQWDEVTVSGVINGVKNKTLLLLSQVKLVEWPGQAEQ